MHGVIVRLKRYINSELHTLKKYSKKKEFYIWIGLLVLLFAVFYSNSIHEKFTDEFDNILGGIYILHGKLPYVGFFSHHGPVAYWIASIIALFSGASFVSFRFFYAIFLLLLILGGYYAVRKSVGDMSSRFYIGFIAIFAIAATYFWGHMLLADSLAAVLIAPAFTICFLKGVYNIPFRIRDLVIISILLAASFLTSLTFIYLIAGMYLFVVLHYFSKLRHRNIKTILFPFLVLTAPYAVFLFYLVITGSLFQYFEQSILFNQKYYIYNYPRPENSTTFNPIRYAIVISFAFYNNFRDLLLQVPSFNFSFPVNITLALGNLFVLIYLLFRRKFLMFFFVLFVLIFSNTRTSPIDSKEGDFQSAVYIVISFINISFLLTKLWEKLTSAISTHARVIYSLLFILLSIYTFYTVSFLLQGFFSKTYNKYMGLEPTIYDRPEIAPIVNQATPENEYAWIGPVAFEELLYLDRPIPNKYHIIIPGMGKSEELSLKVVGEYEKNKPTVIWFDKRSGILGKGPEQYAPFFMEFLKNNYVTLYNEETKTKKYSSVIPISIHKDLETQLYIRRDKYNEVVTRLLQNNLIKPAE